MSFNLLQDCIDMDVKMTASAHSVLVVICRHANDAGTCFPSTALIAKKSHLNPRTVMQAVKELEQDAWISCAQSAGQKRFFTVNAGKIKAHVTPVENCTPAKSSTPARSCTPAENCSGAGNCSTPLQKTAVAPCRKLQTNKKVISKEEVSSCAPSSTESVTPPPADFTFIADDKYDAQGYLIQPEPVEAVKTEKTKKEKKASKKPVLIKPDDCSQEVFDEWVAYKNSLKGKAKCSQRMVDFIAKEAKAAGITSERAMVICMERGWQSFKASYEFGSKSSSDANTFGRLTPQQQREVEEIMAERKAAEQHQEPSFRNLSASVKDEFDAGALDLIQGVL